jgi:hypothetical protein
MSKLSKPSTTLARSATGGNLHDSKNVSSVSDEKKASFDDLMKKLMFTYNCLFNYF